MKQIVQQRNQNISKMSIMMADDGDFEQADSGASATYPQQCSALRKNGYVMIKNKPCKIVEMLTSKTGKHGHAKVHLVGLDIFTGKKYEDICPSTHNMDVPNVSRKEYQLIDITYDGYLSLLVEGADPKVDLKLPESDVGKEIKKAFDDGKDCLVTVLCAMDEEAPIALKIQP